MKVVSKSEIGLVRKSNQDSLRYVENEKKAFLAIICDGIGGGNAGDVASAMACEIFAHDFKKNPDLSDSAKVGEWIHNEASLCNDQIFTKSTENKDFAGMGTTMVGCIINQQDTYIFNIGDSRAYALYEGLVCLTQDHNLYQELLNSGQLDPQQAKHYPKRNVLTNALGIWNSVRVDVEVIKASYSLLLLCSDGLHAYVPEEEIAGILTEPNSLDEKAEQLVQVSLLAGGYDNISLIIIDKEGN